MYYFIDLCHGIGGLRKAFERTGAYACVLAADIDENSRNLYKSIFGTPKPLGDVTTKEVDEVIKRTNYDILLAGLNGLGDTIFFKILEIIERDKPKAFVLEMDTSVQTKSLIKIAKHFCTEHKYHLMGYEKSIEDVTLNQINFGVPESLERVWIVGIHEKESRCDDPVFMQLNKKNHFECYKYIDFDPEKNILQKRGFDWGFGNNRFKFLMGTPVAAQKRLIEEATSIPMAASVALDLMTLLK